MSQNVLKRNAPRINGNDDLFNLTLNLVTRKNCKVTHAKPSKVVYTISCAQLWMT